MADPLITTWWLNLDGLDVAFAVFEHQPPMGGPGTATLKIDREEWEKLGRPGKIQVVVQKDEG